MTAVMQIVGMALLIGPLAVLCAGFAIASRRRRAAERLEDLRAASSASGEP